FGNQPIGSTSTVQSVTVTNTGNTTLIITSIASFGGDASSFTATNNTCVGIPIAPGGSCTVGVLFNPTVTGPLSSSLRILSNSGTGINDIPIRGIGVAPLMVLEPTPLNFGTQAVSIASAPRTINV